MKLVVIADDFTGATDIASFLVEAGLDTIQFSGPPPKDMTIDTQAVVISLKSRSCPKQEAIADTLDALKWAKSQGCKHIYFKYCSTFDSTPQGNIGPVTDALMDAMGEKSTIICPALPINGRTSYMGYLFVNDVLLSESPMKNHPITPMMDSSILRLMEAQSKGKAALIDIHTIKSGISAVRKKILELKAQSFNYIICDAIDMDDLDIIAEASLGEFRLFTGGSGLGGGLGKQLKSPNKNLETVKNKGLPPQAPTVILAGSCSAMSQKQVAAYKQKAPSFQIDVAQCIRNGNAYANQLFYWYSEHNNTPLAPLLYATTNTENLKEIQTQYGGNTASEAVEKVFYILSQKLKEYGVRNFIVAGGETSGSVTQALKVDAFYIGSQITPGVPWVRSLDGELSLALKSGNFGSENFFEAAQKMIVVS
ncbi:MAG: 3-oxo-tetronate kinase [Alphaproteobacteria bacterium]